MCPRQTMSCKHVACVGTSLIPRPGYEVHFLPVGTCTDSVIMYHACIQFFPMSRKLFAFTANKYIHFALQHCVLIQQTL